MTDCNELMKSYFLNASSYLDVEIVHLKEDINLSSKPAWSMMRCPIFWDSTKRLKSYFYLRRSKLLDAVWKTFNIFIRGSHQSRHEEVAETVVASRSKTTKRMNIAEKNYTLCLQYPKTQYFYIASTEHDFEGDICSHVGDIHYCYILHAKILSLEMGLFCKNVSFQPLYGSIEKNEGQMQNRESQDRHEVNRGAAFTDSKLFGEECEDIKSEWIVYLVNKVIYQLCVLL